MELARLHDWGLLLLRSERFQHGDPANRRIGATASQLDAPLIAAAAGLRALAAQGTLL